MTKKKIFNSSFCKKQTLFLLMIQILCNFFLSTLLLSNLFLWWKRTKKAFSRSRVRGAFFRVFSGTEYTIVHTYMSHSYALPDLKDLKAIYQLAQHIKGISGGGDPVMTLLGFTSDELKRQICQAAGSDISFAKSSYQKDTAINEDDQAEYKQTLARLEQDQKNFCPAVNP